MYPVTLLKRIWRSSLRGNTSSFCLLVAAADSPISRVALGGPPSPTLPLDTEPNYTRKVNRLVLDQHCWWISCHSKTSQSFGHDVTLCLLMAKSNRNVRSCCLTGTVHGTRWSLAVLSGLGFQSEWNFGKTGQRSTDWHFVRNSSNTMGILHSLFGWAALANQKQLIFSKHGFARSHLHLYNHILNWIDQKFQCLFSLPFWCCIEIFLVASSITTKAPGHGRLNREPPSRWIPTPEPWCKKLTSSVDYAL